MKQGHIDMLDKYDWLFEGELLNQQPIQLEKAAISPMELEETEAPYIQEAYEQTIDHIKGFFKGILSRLDTNAESVFQQFSTVLEEVMNNEDHAVTLIYEVKDYDETTFRHSLNVGLIAGLIGKILKLPSDQVFLLGKMGLLHDIGKMKIPNEILKKPGRLTDGEYKTIKLHTKYGFEILRGVEGLDLMISIGALTHHERLDGSGYPDGRTEKNIPYLAQILAVADIYDAICTERAYQKGRSSFIAIEQLVQDAKAGKLNTAVVKSFVGYLMKQYVGRNVVLNNGERGTITFIPYDEPHRPLLKVGADFLDLKKVSTVSITDFAC
ncbi:HD-GYP domain-containing protein [Pseudalkalibacillus sp. SCS-8]|uniref:HD-GYP domain-containing protein n=1 Tax=Pseudalkalibacillus nanhaiensis TaxID=3115291 RepID=UPI0032DAF3A7